MIIWKVSTRFQHIFKWFWHLSTAQGQDWAIAMYNEDNINLRYLPSVKDRLEQAGGHWLGKPVPLYFPNFPNSTIQCQVPSSWAESMASRCKMSRCVCSNKQHFFKYIFRSFSKCTHENVFGDSLCKDVPWELEAARAQRLWMCSWSRFPMATGFWSLTDFTRFFQWSFAVSKLGFVCSISFLGGAEEQFQEALIHDRRGDSGGWINRWSRTTHIFQQIWTKACSDQRTLRLSQDAQRTATPTPLIRTSKDYIVTIIVL